MYFNLSLQLISTWYQCVCLSVFMTELHGHAVIFASRHWPRRKKQQHVCPKTLSHVVTIVASAQLCYKTLCHHWQSVFMSNCQSFLFQNSLVCPTNFQNKCLSYQLFGPIVSLSISLSVQQFVCPTVCLSIWLSVQLSVCPTICRSVCLHSNWMSTSIF